jgi:hypothetical protein
LNPGPPAPQAGILDQTRRRPHSDRGLCTKIGDSDHRDTQKIVNTLINLKRKGLSDQTVKNVSHKLKQMSKQTDLDNPTAVTDFIANHNVTNATKTTLVQVYNY